MSLPPKIDRRTYEEIVQQIQALAEDFTIEIKGGWKPPGAIELPKSELLYNLILNEDIPITVEPTVAQLTGRILNEDVDLGNNIIKKGTLVNENQAQEIVQIKGTENKQVEVLLATRNTFIDTTLAQQISQIDGLTQVKVKLQQPGVIELERKYWIDRTLAQDISSIPVKSGTLIDEDVAKKIEQQGINKVKVKIEADAGEALIRIFGRMVKLVSDRLNQVPEKNFLAFLDLIGGQLKPPQPAKVPLTFYLAEGSPVDGLVPVHTQVSAPPAESSDEEIVFETDQELVVTTTQLQAVFMREPGQDKYGDYTLAATGQQDAAFFVLEGDRPIPHSLYITCPEIFTLPELKQLKLIITTENSSQFPNLPLNWSYWDGSQWQLQTPSPIDEKNQFTFTNLPIPTASEIHGQTGKWLQANLTPISEVPNILNIQASVDITQSNLTPEVCLFNTTPLDLSKDFYPFGEQPNLNDTFYIALHDPFIKPHITITIDIEFKYKPVNVNNLKISWEIFNGQVWQKISESDAIQEKLQLPNQKNISSPSTVNGETRYWIRARITQGHYGKAADARRYPIYDDLAVLIEPRIKTNSEIKVDSLDLFKVGDTIRLLPNTGGFPEEHQITKINIDSKQLTLSRGILNDNLAVGTRIMRKLIITETIPPTYDPPLLKSLKLSYEFTLIEDAVYCANNDFSYYHPKLFTTKFKQKPTIRDKIITLAGVEDLAIGEFLKINTENYQIAAINFETNQVSITSEISQDYSKDTPVNRFFRPFTPTVDRDPTLYLGFDKSFNNKTVTLYAQVEPPLSDELANDLVYSQPQLVWEYSSPLGWQPLGVQDKTQAFFQRGLIQFIAPVDFSKIQIFGKQLYWLRIRWHPGNFRIKPRLRRLLTNTIWAVQATTLREEVLGSSNYDPNQVFVATNTPILIGQQLEIQEGQIPPELKPNQLKVIQDDLGEIEEVWVLWQEVPDFYGSGASDRHYILDRQTGEIRFGDGQAGMIPPRGRNNIRLSFYRTGGGKQGNVALETISQLKTTIPYIDRVINLEAAAGGAQQETLDCLKQRVPKQLRHSDRAVTVEDMADLAYEASTDVARVKVVSPDLLTAYSPLNQKFWLDPTKVDVSLEEKLQAISNDDERAMMQEINHSAGQVKLIILPYSSDRQPTPSLALLKQVEIYIRSRCEATVDLVVTVPKWQEISVTTTITPTSLEKADVIRNTVRQSLEAFLHPLTGGRGEGWQFGRYPQKSDFYAIIQSISGVDHVNSLEISASSLSADSLIYSGNHTVNVTSQRRG